MCNIVEHYSAMFTSVMNDQRSVGCNCYKLQCCLVYDELKTLINNNMTKYWIVIVLVRLLIMYTQLAFINVSLILLLQKGTWYSSSVCRKYWINYTKWSLNLSWLLEKLLVVIEIASLVNNESFRYCWTQLTNIKETMFLIKILFQYVTWPINQIINF